MIVFWLKHYIGIHHTWVKTDCCFKERLHLWEGRQCARMSKIWVLFPFVPQIAQVLWKSLLLSDWALPVIKLWFWYIYSLKCFENCWLNVPCKKCLLLSLFWFFWEIFLDVCIFSFISKQNRLLIDSGGFGVSVVYEMYSTHQNIYYLVANTSGLLPLALWVWEEMVVMSPVIL